MGGGRRAGLATAVLAGMALAGCNPTGETGYVEIRTVPTNAQRQPTLYLDSARIEPVQKGIAVLKQRTGTMTLAVDGFGGQPVPICDVEVKTNRITTVTVSVLERPPRCQCRNSSPARLCVS